MEVVTAKDVLPGGNMWPVDPHIEKIPTPELAPAVESKAAPRSRAESMFGARSGWNMPAAGQGNAERPDGQEAYKGFLFIRCEECGEVKGFNSKHPATYFQCNCGHRTALRGLRMAHVRCNKCGGEFNYRTNLQTDFTIDCLTCGSPVDMERGAKGTAFVPVGQKFSGGGYTEMVNLTFSVKFPATGKEVEA